MTTQEILDWLQEEKEDRIRHLFEKADLVRKESVGDKVLLRGIVEFSSYCSNTCSYCGLNARRKGLKRYRMTAEEIIKCAGEIAGCGIGTIVLQSGQDEGFSPDWMSKIIHEIKKRYKLAITLSLGQRSYHELKEWKKAGADRYFLKFETSNDDLYKKTHPGRNTSFIDRLKVLETARAIEYEIGSGTMIGLPDQSIESIAEDISLFSELDLDMVGVGPYIPHPDTELGKKNSDFKDISSMVYKVISLVRLTRPYSNIPTTTALATVDFLEGYRKGLLCGANVIMPNFTPTRYKRLYEIYPTELSKIEKEEMIRKIKDFVISIGRKIGKGRGDSINFKMRKAKEFLCTN